MAKFGSKLHQKQLFLSIIGIVIYCSLHAQVLTDDTVVCIIDTTKNYVKFTENPIQRDDYQFPHHWQVAIDGHYYDQRSYKDIACIVFDAGLWSGVEGVEGFPQKTVPKEGLAERYIVTHDKWINLQTSMDTLQQKIGIAPFDKYNYIIFSQDFYSDSDSVTMHRVELGYNEVVH